MTIRRRPVKEGEAEEVSLFGVLTGKKSYHTVIICLILSMHPLGRQILGTVGFKFPDEQKLVVATEESKNVRADITQINGKFDELKKDLESVKANNAIINTKVDNLVQNFTGFQVDFQRYRKSETAAPQ